MSALNCCKLHVVFIGFEKLSLGLVFTQSLPDNMVEKKIDIDSLFFTPGIVAWPVQHGIPAHETSICELGVTPCEWLSFQPIDGLNAPVFAEDVKDLVLDIVQIFVELILRTKDIFLQSIRFWNPFKVLMTEKIKEP